MLSANGVIITPTIFPDKTSQVWKIHEEIINSSEIIIQWNFEQESEFVHLIQLCDLLLEYGNKIVLFTPYLPYARQDKLISNDKTFSLRTFAKIIKYYIDYISCFDAHNIETLKDYFDNEQIINIDPVDNIKKAIEDFNADLICYPDSGAKNRYSKILDFPSISMKKVRDQLTGKILSITPEDDNIIEGKNILIVDDICDGGRTFIQTAEGLPNNNIGLYVSHGIFSAGLPLKGISQIYCVNNLKDNKFMEFQKV